MSAEHDDQAEYDQIRERQAQLRRRIAERGAAFAELAAAYPIEELKHEQVELEACVERLKRRSVEEPVVALPDQEMPWLLRKLPSSQTLYLLAMIAFLTQTAMTVVGVGEGTRWTIWRFVGLAGALVGVSGTCLAWRNRRKADVRA